MAKIGKISGFPEWLPEQKLIENQIIDRIRKLYESFGFTPIETPAVELITTLASKGVVDKEIFAVNRLQAESEKAELGLHFDLTVPFARYVAQHAHELIFPFKRYQLQKVWRGDRPQKGRFREFYQFDIDTIARDVLPISCDAEVLTVLERAISFLGVGPFRLQLNNRKLLKGFYSDLNLSEAAIKSAIIAVDKLHKIGADGVKKELMLIDGMTPEAASRIIDATTLQIKALDAEKKLRELSSSDLFNQGLAEMSELLALLPPKVIEKITVDFSLARGLDYYTGMIVEAAFIDYPDFGTVASGGRYENLASDFCDQKLPGVGVSIGLTRILDLMFDKGIVAPNIKTPAEVLVTVLSEEQRVACNEIGDQFREAGVACEVFFKSPKLGKQIEYAEAKGMRFVAFLSESGGIEVKDLKSKEQKAVSSIANWAKERAK